MSNKQRMSAMESEFVNLPYLKTDVVEAREYQTELSQSARDESSLVALPTGTGKTIVSLLIMAHRIENCGGKAVFLAPSKPLVQQQADFFNEVMEIPEHEIQVFTGEVRPDEREDLWNGAVSIVSATPQVIQNDLISGRIDLEDVCHITFDECHKATGDYAYTYIAERYWKDATDPLVTGLSASPGSDRENIMEVAQNLGVTNIEVVTEDDERLQEYTYEVELDPVYVPLDEEILEMRDLLEGVYADLLTKLKSAGVLNSRDKKKVGYNQLNAGMGRARKNDQYKMLSLCSEARRLDTALEKIETQGPSQLETTLQSYLDSAEESDASKAVKRLVKRPEFKKALELASEYDKTHPKKVSLTGFLKDTLLDNGQAIVFTEYRETAINLVEYLNQFGPVDAHRFVGQNNDDGHGLSQSKQQEVLDAFRNGEHNVLVSTSVGEEGLDIPQVDLVVFYEPVSSGIRSIQRRGRTGRASQGKVKILIAKDTRDVGYWYASKRREDNMNEGLSDLSEMAAELTDELRTQQQSLKQYTERESVPETTTSSEDGESEQTTQSTLPTGDAVATAKETAESVEQPTPNGDENEIVVIADTRESKSAVPRTLDLTSGVTVQIQQLEVGDFVLSDRVAVERKSVQDFADTLVGSSDRSMFEQAANLVNNYDRGVVIVEGTLEELYEARNIHPKAIQGALVSLAVDFGVSLMWSRSESETADILATIAEREQVENEKQVSAHGKKQSKTDRDQQEYIISSVSGIGPVTAQNLLAELGSVHAVMTAEVDDLKQASGVGDVLATEFYEMIRQEYTN